MRTCVWTGGGAPIRFRGARASARRRQHLDGASEQLSFEETYSAHTDTPYVAAMAQKTLTWLRPCLARRAPRITVPTAPMLSHHRNTSRPGASAIAMESAKMFAQSSYSTIPGRMGDPFAHMRMSHWAYSIYEYHAPDVPGAGSVGIGHRGREIAIADPTGDGVRNTCDPPRYGLFQLVRKEPCSGRLFRILSVRKRA